MTDENSQNPEIIDETPDQHTENNQNQKKPENTEQEGKGSVSSDMAFSAALEHWHTILSNPEASDTAKMNAANGLARFGQAGLAGHGDKISEMSRSELQAEIAKVREKLELV